MLTLNLDKQFKPLAGKYASEIDYEYVNFHGGERHIKINVGTIPPVPAAEGGIIYITHRLTNSDEIMRLFLAADAVASLNLRPVAFIPYFPYARQDRVMVPGEPHSLRVFTDLFFGLYGARFEQVITYDVHSDVTTALMPGAKFLDNVNFASSAINRIVNEFEHTENIAIVSPDAGALKKVYALSKTIGYQGEVVVGIKSRNVQTGEIIRQSVDGDVKDKVCVIVDDIIDGGRTFLDLAVLLRARGARKVYLVVSHGIFSQGTKHLRGPLDGIFVTNSFRDMNGPQDYGFIHQHQLGING